MGSRRRLRQRVAGYAGPVTIDDATNSIRDDSRPSVAPLRNASDLRRAWAQPSPRDQNDRRDDCKQQPSADHRVRRAHTFDEDARE